MNPRINKSDSQHTRQAKKSFKQKLRKQKNKKQKIAESKREKSLIVYNKDVELFCDINNISLWGSIGARAIRLGEHVNLFLNPELVLRTLLKLLYTAKTHYDFPKITVEGRVSFGSIYLIDNMCWEIARKRKWQVLMNNICRDDMEIFSKIKSIASTEYQDETAYMISEKVKINRSDDPFPNQQYKVKSKEITDLVIQGMRENYDPNFSLSPEAYAAISSTIGEHFDNILSHVPFAESGYLCGFYDKNAKTVSILIFNFGHTIHKTFTNRNLPKEIRKEINQVISVYKQKGFFNYFSKTFTEENAITLLALQEGVSSRLEYDKSRGHGLMDYIEHCFTLNKNCKISFISGNTAIKIDNKYALDTKFFIDRNRRILAFNSTNDLYKKPDPEYVRNMGVHFPGVIIETIIPLT
jgi:hypothetical protein